MAQGYAYARHEQSLSHRAAAHRPLHLSPVYITSSICSLMLFLWIQIKHHPPICYTSLTWTRGMANGCPTSTTSSLPLFFLLSCLLIGHALCSQAHNGRTSGIQALPLLTHKPWLVYFLFPCTRLVPSFFWPLLFVCFHCLFTHFNLIWGEDADYVVQFPHQELTTKHIILPKVIKVPLSLSLSTVAK
jgi:hypothetical protein